MNEANRRSLEALARWLNEELWEPFKNEERIPIIREALDAAFNAGYLEAENAEMGDLETETLVTE